MSVHLRHTFHPGGVRDTTDRMGGIVTHLVNGPEARVWAYVGRLEGLHPDARIVGGWGQSGVVEVVIHRTAQPMA